MIAGRFHWKDAVRAPVPKKVGLAAFDVPGATLLLTEASPKKRAALHVVATEEELAALSRGGIEPLEADLASFAAALRSESHTVKRALTDPRLFSGIGNAYSDEILHAARMSPFALTRKLGDDEVARLFEATRTTLTSWLERLRAETGDRFPGEGDGVSPGLRRPRPLRQALPRVRRPGAAARLRRQRGQLLRHVPDREDGSSPTVRCRAS